MRHATILTAIFLDQENGRVPHYCPEPCPREAGIGWMSVLTLELGFYHDQDMDGFPTMLNGHIFRCSLPVGYQESVISGFLCTSDGDRVTPRWQICDQLERPRVLGGSGHGSQRRSHPARSQNVSRMRPPLSCLTVPDPDNF
jgi:hypothetical protein